MESKRYGSRTICTEKECDQICNKSKQGSIEIEHLTKRKSYIDMAINSLMDWPPICCASGAPVRSSVLNKKTAICSKAI